MYQLVYTALVYKQEYVFHCVLPNDNGAEMQLMLLQKGKTQSPNAVVWEFSCTHM